MKYLAWIGGILLIFTATVYGVLFTPFGNGLIKPIAESKIREQTKLDSKLTKFSLTSRNFEIILELNSNNTIKIEGDYSLFSRAFELSYEAGFQKLESLEPFTLTALRGTLYTNGTVKGNMAFMKVDGKSDIGDSHTAYYVELTDLNPTSIVAKMKDAKLSSLLYTVAKNPYATADMDLEINFKNINPHTMDGDIVLKSKNGIIDPKYMKSDFNVTIPKTSFSMNLDAKLKGDNVDYNYNFASNLFKIATSGRVVPEPLKADIKYSLNIQELEALKPITGTDIRGSLKLEGEAKGDKERLTVSGISDLASSDTVFEAILKDFELASLRAKIETLKIEKLLFMLKQPHYMDGLLFMNVEIGNAKDFTQNGAALNGQVANARFEKNQIFDGVKEFAKFDMYKEFFNGDINAKVYKDNILASLNLRSAEASIKIKEAKINTKTKQIDSDITLQAKKNVLSAALNGDIDAPRVSINLEEFMKTEAGKEVQEKINKEVDKLLQKLLK
ncbi:MAG: hypothetical protein PHO62_08235 [Sulfurimonas sp.]|uniref:hypothetical protein n=1 Tax=Sulfurimonas sp. TaxID=2022749 RepID=UPI00262840E5|nr:hypothetical protein [Sulfurimonas sp.]MDD5373397.1 hypothetical protein [Sulfurimonas sp.]